jgi:hypothetical protein
MGQPLRDRPTRHEQAPDLLRPGADTAFRCPGDPEAVAVVVAWRGGLRQPPAGLLTPTRGEPMTARPMPRLAEQLPRRAGYAAGQLQRLARGAQQLVADLDKAIVRSSAPWRGLAEVKEGGQGPAAPPRRGRASSG